MSDIELELRDYQAHASTSIKIGEGVTVIVGPTDNGKSSIIRAFRDLCFGPRGAKNVRYGKKEFSVTLRKDLATEGDTRVVTLTKGKSKNRYVIQNWNYGKVEEEIPFEGHGLAVPEEVTKALGVRAVEVDKDTSFTPQFVGQHGDEVLFLLSMGAQKVARVIGSVTELHVVLAAIREASASADAQTKIAAALTVEAEIDAERDRVLGDQLARLDPVRGVVADLLAQHARNTDLSAGASSSAGRITAAMTAHTEARTKVERLRRITAVVARVRAAAADGRARTAREGTARYLADTIRKSAQAVAERMIEVERAVALPEIRSARETARLALIRAQALLKASRLIGGLEIIRDNVRGKALDVVAVRVTITAGYAAATESRKRGDAARIVRAWTEQANSARMTWARVRGEALAQRQQLEQEFPACPVCGAGRHGGNHG